MGHYLEIREINAWYIDCGTVMAQNDSGRVKEKFNPDTSDEVGRCWLPPPSQTGSQLGIINLSKNLLPWQLSHFRSCLTFLIRFPHLTLLPGPEHADEVSSNTPDLATVVHGHTNLTPGPWPPPQGHNYWPLNKQTSSLKLFQTCVLCPGTHCLTKILPASTFPGQASPPSLQLDALQVWIAQGRISGGGVYVSGSINLIMLP